MICAVIDDGVCITHYPFLNRLAGSLAVTERGIIPELPAKECTHGTYCAAVIRLYAPHTEILSIRVLNSITGQGDVQSIRKALAWCVDQPVSVINLSIGSTSFREWPLLRPIISQLLRKGTAFICAWPNQGHFSVYTGFGWAISVQADDNLYGNQFYASNGTLLNADFFASSHHIFPISKHKTEVLVSQNSHAVPVITARICNIIKEKGSMPPGTLFQLLFNDGSRRKSNFHLRLLPDFIDTAVICGNSQYSKNLWAFQEEQKSIQQVIHSNDPFFLCVFPSTVQVDEIRTIVYQSQGRLLGLLWAGVAPNTMKDIVKEAGCLFWDESEYEAVLAQLQLKSNSTDTPRITIRGDPQRSIRITQLLQEKMIEEGISILAFSALPQSYCLGMIFLPQQVDTNRVVGAIEQIYNPEVLLFCGEVSEISSDAVINCEEKQYLLTCDEKYINCHTCAEVVEEVMKLLF